jgi:hypothetical protein
MKKVYLILPVFVFALACNTIADPRAEQQAAQLKAVVAMEQKVNKVITQLRADCDSSLLSLAKLQADSIRNTASARKPARKRAK